MAKKPVGVPLRGEGDPTPTNGDPVVALLLALAGLQAACSNAGVFRELGERRARARDLAIAFLPARAAIIAKRADTKAKGRATFKQVSAELEGLTKAATTPPKPEPAGMLKPLHAVLESGREWCKRAREAVRKGGANALADDAKAEPRKMLARLGRADELFVMLGVDLSDPSAIIDGHVVELDELGKWVGDTYHDLKAAMELGGAIPPATANDATVAGDDRPTQSDLRDALHPVVMGDDTFARIRKAAGIAMPGRGAKSRRRRYSADEVGRMIRAWRAGGFLRRYRLDDAWARWAESTQTTKPQPSRK